jgi:23S rRNA pseudouridine1911/1915/1917 synthase
VSGGQIVRAWRIIRASESRVGHGDGICVPSFQTRLPMPNKSQLPILWQSDDAIAVSKPAGLATIPGRDDPASVLHALGGQIGLPVSGHADPRLRVVHRLDKDTSGVLLFAKNIDMQRHLSRQFKENSIAKEYLALVSGRPPEKEGEVNAPLARHPTSKTRMAIVTHGGRPARTLWKIEEVFRDYTLLRVFPRTGKTHQIRIHLHSIGLPLAIDPLYHAPAPGRPAGIFLSRFKRAYSPTFGEEERPLIDRLTLHAGKISFMDRAGTPVTVICEVPKDLRAVLNQLRRWGR